LQSAGNHELVGISRRRPADDPPYAGVSWYEGDLSDRLAAAPVLAEALQGAEVVVNLAWMIQPSHDRELMRRTNVEGTRLVADAARTAGVAHLVHMSSIGTYSPGAGRRVDEAWPVEGVPTSYYSVDKAACEALLAGYEADLTVSRIRPTLILQPQAASEIARYFLGRLVPVSAAAPAVLRLLPWPAALTVQFVHAEDVANAVAAVIEAREAGAFNVASDPAVDRAEFRRIFGGVGPALPPRLLRILADVSWRARLQPTGPGWIDLAIALPLLDCSRIQALGWRPKHSGLETLEAFVAALRRREGGPGPLLFRRKAGQLLRGHGST
jgi:nucleoside-diphosphate-sugar epimerase